MRKKFWRIVFFVFVFSGVLLIFSGIGQFKINEGDPDAFLNGIVLGLIGVVILILCVIGLFLYNRFEPSQPIPWDKARKKMLGL